MAMEVMTELVFKAAAEALLGRAFHLVLRSRPQSALLAREVVRHARFKSMDKRRLLQDPEYFRRTLGEFRSLDGGVAQSVDRILQDPDHVGQIQRALTRHPFLEPSSRNGHSARRSNFLILGHRRAGKTVFLYRILHALAKNHGTSVFGSERDPVELDGKERNEAYRQYLRKLARLNDELDRGILPDATILDRTFPVFLDLVFPRFEWTYGLRFMDYAGSRIDDIHSLESLIGEDPIDGILLIIDCHRLIAEDLVEAAYKKKILERSAHEAAFRAQFDSWSEAQSQISEEMLIYISHLSRERSLPVSVVLTKFDGFAEYDVGIDQAKRHVYKHLGGTLGKMATAGSQPLSICLASSFGRSRLARKPDGSLILDDDSLGLPGHVPAGRFSVHERAGVILPVLFLIQMNMQRRIAADREALCRRMREMHWWTRLRERSVFRDVLTHFDREASHWQPVDEDNHRFLCLDPADKEHADTRLKAFFQTHEERGC